jgi:transposase
MDSLELSRPRQVGIEQLALHALQQLKLIDKLQELGFNRHELAAAIGNIVGRMASPASEWATYHWLQQQSGLGELIGYDFDAMGHDRLYQASDLLWKHKAVLEAHLWQREQTLFDLKETIALYDLTNTFFEGAPDSELAQRGRSKERRSDCPLVTLGLVLDSSGFPRCSRHFAGNVSEPSTLEGLLTELEASPHSTVIMDAGIASEKNLQWLKGAGYHYIVVSRQPHREFDETQATLIKESPGNCVRAQRVEDSERGEVKLYCHSEARELKEQAILDSMAQRFEAGLTALNEGLSKPRCTKSSEKIHERIGRLKQKYSRAAARYTISVSEQEGKATAITWSLNDAVDSAASHPGVYCLRTDLLDWDAAKLWQTYILLTDLEAVFRSLKSELGMRPVYHHTADRLEGHLFITLLGYHLVHTLRHQLKAHDIHASWTSLRQLFANRQRVSVTVKREDNRTIHLRKTTRIEPHQRPVLDALGLDYSVHPTKMTLI